MGFLPVLKVVMLSAPLESLPRVTPGSFLTLHYRMAAAAVNGQPGADIINTFAGKPATLSLGGGQLSPALEQRLLGLSEGARVSVSSRKQVKNDSMGGEAAGSQ
jgi:FKBP-type peptidyl-prolyl cis-trans isomerase SlpA